MLDEHAMELLDLYVSAERDRSSIHFRMSKGKSVHEWTVRRAENPALATDADEAEE
jgi:precorrin-6B methylase 2